MNIYTTNATQEGVEGRKVRCENKAEACRLLRVDVAHLQLVEANVKRNASEKALIHFTNTPMNLLALHTIKDEERRRSYSRSVLNDQSRHSGKGQGGKKARA